MSRKSKWASKFQLISLDRLLMAKLKSKVEGRKIKRPSKMS